MAGRGSYLILLLGCALLTPHVLQAQHTQGSNAPVDISKDPSKMDAEELTALARSQMNGPKNYPYALALVHRALRKSPRDIDLNFLMSKLYMLNHYPDSADDLLRQIVLKDPKYRDAYVLLANIQMGKNDTEDALCFIDDGLYFYPSDKELALKKFAILQTLRNPAQADQQGDDLLNRYDQDTTVLRAYIDYKIESARRYAKLKDYTRSLYEYRKALEVDPLNQDALQGIYAAQVRSGNYEDALSGVNSALNDSPEDYGLLTRKMSLLQELRRYPEAIEVLQHILKAYPSDVKARQMDLDLRMEAGRYFMSEDPYLQFQSVLEKSPSNREALDYVINLASARGLNQDALVFVNRALKYYPEDRGLLTKKISILESLQKYPAAADIARWLWSVSGHAPVYKDQFMDLTESSGRYYMNQLQYDSALADFRSILDISPAEPSALNYSINILAAQKNYDAAVGLLDKALQYYPGNEGLLLKKAGILEEDTRYAEASEVLEQLMGTDPDNVRVRYSYIDLAMIQGRQMMQAEDFDAAYAQFSGVIRLQPDNAEALGTLINIELARAQQFCGGASGQELHAGPCGEALDSALALVDRALGYNPSSKDFQVRKASVLEAQQRYPEAYALTDSLMRRYPYNAKIREQYIDERMSSGRLYNAQGKSDSALAEFERVLSLKPRDSLALTYAINILNTWGSATSVSRAASSDSVALDSALVLINKGLRYYPGNEYFTLKRAVVLENMGRFASALPAADSVAKMDPTADHKDYADYLRSKSFRNAIGLTYLSSHFDSLESANIATLHYVHYTRNGSSFDTKLNFAGRSTGTGIQLEEEVYYTHNQKWSSYGDAALASDAVFPRVRLAYSLFRNFDHGWEAELGGRYLNLDSISLYSALGSVSKYFGDFYVTLRGYLIFAPGHMYEAGVLTARQYLNKTDFLYGALGVGNSPDEFSRNYQLATNLGNQTYSIGAGYQKSFSYRNILNLSGTWYNQRLDPGRYRNQYDITLSFLRKF